MNMCPVNKHQGRVKLNKHKSENICEVKRERNCGVEAMLYCRVDVTP